MFRASEHAIGRAIVRYAEENEKCKLVCTEDAIIVPGRGLKCNVIGTEVLVGNAMWMEDNSLVAPKTHSFGKYEDQGKTAVYAAIDDEIGLDCLTFDVCVAFD